MVLFNINKKDNWYALGGIGLLLSVLVVYLYNQGRSFICTCGQVTLWTGAWSSDNSQQIADPYSFSHFQHGLIFFLILKWIFPKMSFVWSLFISILVEVAWEVMENTEVLIQRYRENTGSTDYTGDSILNSVFDVVFCVLGFVLVKYIGKKWAIIIFIIIEVSMLILIRDSLLLNVFMLVYPVEAIKSWQLNH